MLPILKVLELVRTLMKFPPIDDEMALRAALQKAWEILQAVTAVTPTKLDDLAMTAFGVLVNNDEAWDVFYRLLKFAAGSDDLPKLVAITGLSEDQIIHLRNAVLDQAVEKPSGFGSISIA